MHLQTAYTRFGDGIGAHPISEALCDRVLSLPMHPYLDTDTLDRIVEAVKTTLVDDTAS